MLDDFDSRDTSTSLVDLNEEFRLFVQLKSSTHTPAKDSHEMVRPSGPQYARQALRGHYPSFTTKYPTDGEMVDLTNQCMKLLIDAGLGKNEIFWYDTFSRRERRDAPGKVVNLEERYNSDTLRANREWLKLVSKNMSAKVEIVLGKTERARILRSLQGRTETMFLWTEPPVELELVFVDTRKSMINYIFIFVDHPEFFFYNWNVKRAELMDARLSISLAMSCVLPQRVHKSPQTRLDGEVNLLESGDDGDDDIYRCRYRITFFGNRARRWSTVPFTRNGKLRNSGVQPTSSLNPEDMRRAVLLQILAPLAEFEKEGEAMIGFNDLPELVKRWLEKVYRLQGDKAV